MVGHQAIGDGLVHQAAGAIQLGWRHAWVTGKHVTYPFSVDFLCPARLINSVTGNAHEQITQ
jgi:hypothetical protein